MLATILALLAAATLYLFSPLETLSDNSVQARYVFNQVNLVDVTSGEIQPNMSVKVEHGLITQIVSSEEIEISDKFIVINAKGQYVIPGLWDMHTHSLKISPQIHHPLYLAHGVTSVRDMSGCMEQDDSFWACTADRLKWNRQALAGERIAPRYALQSSYQVNGGSEVPDDFSEFFKVSNIGAAKELVQHYQQNGADFIKIHAGLSVEQYDNLVTELASSDIYLAGHKPLNVPLKKALDSGQKSLEHARIFLFGCSEQGAWLTRQEDPYSAFNTELKKQLIESHDKTKCDALMGQMAKSDSWWVPTLTTLKSAAYANKYIKFEEPEFDYIPSLMKSLFWQQDLNNALTKGKDGNGDYIPLDFYHKAKETVGNASRNDVKLLVGTDTLDTAVVAGVSLHDEMIDMVDAGVPALTVLQAATVSAAQFANQTDQYGTIDVGKRADLVFLKGNPLEDIQHIKRISSVVFNGRHLNRQSLERYKLFVKEQAASTRLNSHYLLGIVRSPLMRQQVAD